MRLFSGQFLTMPLSDPKLWDLISKWPLPFRTERDKDAFPARDCACFEHNLRKIGDWTDESSQRIAEAYRRFLYLKAVSGKTLNPPRWIDQAWLLHLSFLPNYRKLEADVGRLLLHGIGRTKRERDEAYDLGRILWCSEFDMEPEEDIWPTRRQLRRGRISASVAVVGFVLVFLSGSYGGRASGALFSVGTIAAIAGLIRASRVQPEIVRRGD